LPTAWRVIAAVTPERLGVLRGARRRASERAWANGAAPERITLDFDATLVTSHSEKPGRRGQLQGRFGFHPLACYLDDPVAGSSPAESASHVDLRVPDVEWRLDLARNPEPLRRLAG
jgi:hypothetical protein